MKTNIVKTGMFCAGGVLSAASALVPVAPAFAGTNGGSSGSLGWTPTDILGKGDADRADATSLTTGNFNAQTLFAWVQNLTNWAFGIAVVLFVLKVVLTAIDRMVFDPDKGGGSGGPGGGPGGGGGGRGGGRQAGGETLLSKIPFVGAYAPDMAWKDIWKNFGKNIAIVAGAWVLVNLITAIVMWVFGILTAPSEG